jgi:hypothetical protein
MRGGVGSLVVFAAFVIVSAQPFATGVAGVNLRLPPTTLLALGLSSSSLSATVLALVILRRRDPACNPIAGSSGMEADKKKAKRRLREERRRLALGAEQQMTAAYDGATKLPGDKKRSPAGGGSNGSEAHAGGKKKKIKTKGNSLQAANGPGGGGAGRSAGGGQRAGEEGKKGKEQVGEGVFVTTARRATSAEGCSKEAAERLFALLIAPITIKEFYRDYFEKKPLLVKRR